MRGISVIFLITAIALAGCEGEDDLPPDQPVLFEYLYVNYAWGYSEHGWLMDGEGDVHRFDFPEDYRSPDSTGYISGEDLAYNLSLCESIINSVESTDLKYYTALMEGAASGEILEPENVAADAGSSVLSCYFYDSSSDMYQYVFLASSGDWVQINDSWEAKTLVKWLKEIGNIFLLAI